MVGKFLFIPFFPPLLVFEIYLFSVMNMNDSFLVFFSLFSYFMKLTNFCFLVTETDLLISSVCTAPINKFFGAGLVVTNILCSFLEIYIFPINF